MASLGKWFQLFTQNPGAAIAGLFGGGGSSSSSKKTSSNSSGSSFSGGGSSGGGRISSGNDVSYTDVSTIPNNESYQAYDDSYIQDRVNNYANLLNQYGLGPGGGSSSSYYSGGFTPERIDLTPIINSYTNAANAQKATLQANADSTRTELLNSIKRFQEDTARSQELQRNAFNSSRADLEEAAFQADRANRISANARGIGGSGLQQLAQLQTLMEQNSSISDLAQENTDVQTQLAQALARQEEDTNADIQTLMTNLANSLQQIDADLGTNIANLQYQEDVRYENARQQAAEAAAASASSARNSYAQALADYAQSLQDQYYPSVALASNVESNFRDMISTITDESELEDTLSSAKDELYTLAQEGNFSSDIYNAAQNNLNLIYNQRLAALKNSEEKTTNNDLWFTPAQILSAQSLGGNNSYNLGRYLQAWLNTR